MAGRLRYRRIEALTNTIENPAGSPSYDAAFLSSPLEPACCPSGGAKPRTAAWHPAVLGLTRDNIFMMEITFCLTLCVCSVGVCGAGVCVRVTS